MPKNTVAQWSTAAADNTDVGGLTLAEGVMLPSGVNNAFREIMAQIATAGFLGTPATVQLTDPNADRLMFWDDSAGSVAWLAPNGAFEFSGTAFRALETIAVSVVSEGTTLTTGTAKRTFRMPFAFTVTGVRASLSTASSSGLPTVDINEGGTTILSTKLTIDANELTSTTSTTAAVISDASLADDSEMTIDIDVAGSGAKGLKVYINGYRPYDESVGPLSSIAFQTSATSSTSSTITCPTVQQYDVGVLIDFAASNTAGVPSTVIPSGFTQLQTSTSGGTTSRGVASYKVFDGSESGSTLTGLTSDGRMTKTLLVFRPNGAIASVAASTWTGDIDTADPASQLISASGQAVPLIRIAGASNNITTNPTLTGTFDATVTQGTGTGRQVVGYKIQNSSPSNDTVDMNDVGTNYLVSGWLSFS